MHNVSRETDARTIAVVNQKGGVGKTTTSVNLAAALALGGSRVLLIDSDPQGNATTGLSGDKSSIERSTYAVLLDAVPLEAAAQDTSVAGLRLVPATLGLAGAEIELVPLADREQRMRGAVQAVARSYDFIFIDCPPSLGLLTLNALTAAEEVLIPVQAEYYALEGLSQLTSIVRRVQESLNPRLHILGVLITMFDDRTRLAREVVDEVHRFFPDRVFKTQIPRNVRLSEAPSFGQPVAIFDSRSRGALAYAALAEEIAGTGVAS